MVKNVKADTTCYATYENKYWTEVPGDTRYGTRDFLISEPMSKCDDPFYSAYCTYSANQETAKTICQSIGAHLMTDNEYLTIARNIENNSQNWAMSAAGYYTLKSATTSTLQKVYYLSNGKTFNAGIPVVIDNRVTWENRPICNSSNGSCYAYGEQGTQLPDIVGSPIIPLQDLKAKNPSHGSERGYGQLYTWACHVSDCRNDSSIIRGRSGLLGLELSFDYENVGKFHCVRNP